MWGWAGIKEGMMLTFHNVVNLSSGPEVTQSDLVHFRRALNLSHSHTRAGTHSGSTWAENCGKSESAVWGSCQTLIFGMMWMLGSGIIDGELPGVSRHEGEGEGCTWWLNWLLKAPIRHEWNVYQEKLIWTACQYFIARTVRMVVLHTKFELKVVLTGQFMSYLWDLLLRSCGTAQISDVLAMLSVKKLGWHSWATRNEQTTLYFRRLHSVWM